MAAVSLSPTPVPFSVAMSSSMSSRRVPLGTNPNAANSPLRTGSAAAAASAAASAAFAKQRRSHASLQREESYGQAPPAKKQMLDKAVDGGVSASASATATTGARASGLRSPSARRVLQVQRASTSRAYSADRIASHHVLQAQPQQAPQQQQASQHHHHHHHHDRHEIQKVSEREAEEVRRWQQSQRQRFPKHVFYFDSLPEELSARLSKQVNFLGAREDKFFSIDITHVVTSRPIPPEEKPASKQQQQQQQQQHALQAKESNVSDVNHEHLQTINPSLLSRTNTHMNELGIATTSLPVKRKLFDTVPSRRMPLAPFGAAEEAIRKPKPTRSTDILQRAREMGKKIWSLEKLQRVLDMLLEPDPYRSAELGQRIRNGGSTTATGSAALFQQGTARFAGDQALLQMLDKERHTGPSDRDPTVATRELIYFKGPYIYVYDIEEKQRPIMVREYAKVADKEEGDWPQLRASAGTRCPFIEDTDQMEMRAEKKRAKMRNTAAAAAAARDAAAAAAGGKGSGASMQKTLASRYAAAATAAGSGARQSTGSKRTLAEMEDGHNRQAVPNKTGGSVSKAGASISLHPAEGTGFGSSASAAAGASASAAADFQAQNAFTSRAKSARCFAGEPVASGLQAAGITSAIRSQMISSATGTLGARAGTSKEIHGLQRKVLQKSTSTSQQDPSSRRPTDASMDPQQQQQNQQQRPNYSRSTSLSRSTAAAQLSAKLNRVLDDSAASNDEKHKRTMSAPVAVQVPRKKKRDPKPGYCENCQDKFDDFDDHIVSHKHRKFAEDERNWVDLDDLLSQLTRRTKYGLDEWL